MWQSWLFFAVIVSTIYTSYWHDNKGENWYLACSQFHLMIYQVILVFSKGKRYLLDFFASTFTLCCRLFCPQYSTVHHIDLRLYRQSIISRRMQSCLKTCPPSRIRGTTDTSFPSKGYKIWINLSGGLLLLQASQSSLAYLGFVEPWILMGGNRTNIRKWVRRH